jgi:6-phosphogluconolactonase (cycloisomerase 2 family)
MKPFTRLMAGASIGALALLAGPASVAHADVHHHDDTAAHALFVQTNDPTNNQVLVFTRAADGTLGAAGTYATGGVGAQETGAAVDPLASQGSLAYDAAHHLLLVVNAGSDTVSVFTVDGTHLELRQTVPSGGSFPSSITVNDEIAYVLDAGGAGAVQGYRIDGHKLHAIEGSNRSLDLANANPPAFLSAPGQVGLTPNGDHLVVTTKANGSIDVFAVRRNGRLGDAPTVNPPAGAVPFAFSFDNAGRLVVVEAGTDSVSTYSISADGTLAVVSGPVTDGQQAACWIAGAGDGNFYVANAGSATLSGFHVDGSGTVSLLPSVATTAGGPIDLVVSPDGRFVYSENGGAGTIDEFAVQPDGSLNPIGQVTGLDPHVIEGLTIS